MLKSLLSTKLITAGMVLLNPMVIVVLVAAVVVIIAMIALRKK
ncbi:MAG: hypothetical protein U0L48_08015 [Acutalibacteraceae bacterium]|nr:hypothetical protein [Acutalibacteraceae bacterium]